MKITATSAVVTALVVTAAIFACNNNSSNSDNKTMGATRKSFLPADAMQSCPLNPDSFNTWFASGKATENGFVNHANSLTFVHDSNCNFYRWSHQMFLWLTSSYKNTTVLASDQFYTVSPDSAGARQLIPHTNGEPLRATGHIKEFGPNRLPVIQTKDGRSMEVIKASSTAPAMVQNDKGAQVEVAHISTENGITQLIDKTGKPIAKAKPLLGKKINPQGVLQEIVKDGRTVLVDANGNIIESESGQATGDALRAQNGSLVYYITMVNDVYAWFLSAVKANKMSGYQFPTTAADLDSICAFARANGVTLNDSTALAMELKTSWVEASSLPDAANYITIDAIIPKYDTSNSKQWVVTGEQTTKLALVGIHIIGTMNGHPEMVWSSLEHVNNTPNASYEYLNSSNKIVRVPQDGGSSWLLSNNAADPSPNISHISVNNDTLNGKNGFAITASNSLRTKPFGAADSNYQPNSQVPNAAASNSQVIGLNNDVYNLLVGNDIRKNYFLIGSTWTSGGAAPDGTSYVGPSSSPNTAIGTSQLANSTMETYFQFGIVYKTHGSCFTCHSNNTSLAPGALSHVWDDLLKGTLPAMKAKP